MIRRSFIVSFYVMSHADSSMSLRSSLSTAQLFSFLLHEFKAPSAYLTLIWRDLILFQCKFRYIYCGAVLSLSFHPPKGFQHHNIYIWVSIPIWINLSSRSKRDFLISIVGKVLELWERESEIIHDITLRPLIKFNANNSFWNYFERWSQTFFAL